MSLLAEIRATTTIPQKHPLMQKILDTMTENERAEMDEIRGMGEVTDWDLTQFLQARGHTVSEHTIWRWRRGHK